MKTLEQFITDNEGQFLEVAGSANAKNQCVDCVNGYIRDVLGLPIIEWTNAIDFKNKANGNYDVILNDLNNLNLVPDVGDIVVYDSPDNIGHICICIRKGTALTFGAFEENWPVGSPCKSSLYKKYVIGNYSVAYYLKPKSGIISDMTDTEKRILEVVNSNNLTEGDVRWLAGLIKDQTVPNLEKKVSELESQVAIIQSQLDDLTVKFNDNAKELSSCQKDLTTANKTISNLTVELETANAEKTNYKKWYEAKCAELKEATTTTKFNLLSWFKKLFIK